ncbi:DUF3667 domain-containing protein [Flavobacterium sp. MC2016-06]|jgi:hypothetical protein|uniref:DUF3667 domain-containing protein n=1 Tax=Flavobacterium sp. MC2016-06 TaxID=2676308 RepID=UPI0012BB17FA|nr:DUF3667 domain-containing protein [Flavobacterium sp. MC2016-06]MBU3861188.1 DUF3667 domain-containing protein [Flavobacterium sp. MC2016-06]
MEITCKNCKETFKGHYCNNCGQPAATHKINWHFLWHDIQHGLLHFDGGIPYSLKQLFTRPGHSIREFIEGKRVRHFKPLSLVAVLAALYGVLYHYFHINLFIEPSNSSTIDLEAFNEWTSTHFAWITIATIPLFTLGTFICFRNQGYNFVEYFVLNTFKATQKLFAHIITFPFIYYFNGTPELKTITTLIYIIDLMLILWTNIQFFNKMSKTKAFLLTLLSHLVFIISFFFVAAIILWIHGDL